MPHLMPSVIQSLNRQTLEALDLVGAIRHPGENGRARENILRDFIASLLPSTYRASTGFVFDSAGNTSRQIDLIVYRHDYAPVFVVGGINHFLIEAVVAVFEVKAAITSTAALGQALDNVRSVLALDRTAGGENYVVVGNQHGPMVDVARYSHRVFGGILTEASLADETLLEQARQYTASHPRAEWPNAYFDARGRTLVYGCDRDGTPGITVDPTEATRLFLSDGAYPSLLTLAEFLLDLVRVAELVDYKPSLYFHSPALSGTTAALPDA